MKTQIAKAAVYNLGDTGEYPCGCVWEFVGFKDGALGFVQFVNPDCEFDNKAHPPIRNYRFEIWDKRPDARPR